jgi:chemotaxis-related protein WspB
MLVLTFRVAEVAYAIAVASIVEVVPRVPLRAVPHAPAHLAGLLRYRGGVVQVVDLGLLMGREACRERLDTRIILADAGPAGGCVIGLVADQVDDVRPVDESRRAVAGIEIGAAPYLGAVFETDEGLLQLIEPDRVLGGLSPVVDGAASP